MKKFIYILLFALPFTAEAQQVPIFSQYVWNHYLINPAVGGADNFLEAKGGYRNQWTGIEGAPQSFYMSAHGQLRKKTVNRDNTDIIVNNEDDEKEPGKVAKALGYKKQESTSIPSSYRVRPHHGVGGMVLADKAGLFTSTSVYGSYAYHLPLTKNIYASVGVFVGVKQFRIDGSRMILEEDGDRAIDYSHNMSGTTPDGIIGMMIYGKRFYLGASVNQIFSGEAAFKSKYDNNITGVYNLEKHFFFTGGVRVRLSDQVSFVPSTMVRYLPSTDPSVDLTGKINYMDLLWAGVSYRTQDAVIFLAGFSYAKKIDVGYSYDVSLSSSRRFYRPNSHEIMIGFRLANRNYGNAVPSYVW
ncbi:MAG: type IX secretion system membrane protein PorP/SprF [Cytophagaceae bacterium]